MRFITEFEISEEEISNPVTPIFTRLSTNCIYNLGQLLSDNFGWKQKEGGNTLQPKERYTLEIEAFPMDKWVEFKERLFKELDKVDPSEIKIGRMIKELESFGNPVTNESK